jgi:hypothetical protein
LAHRWSKAITHEAGGPWQYCQEAKHWIW